MTTMIVVPAVSISFRFARHAGHRVLARFLEHDGPVPAVLLTLIICTAIGSVVSVVGRCRVLPFIVTRSRDVHPARHRVGARPRAAAIGKPRREGLESCRRRSRAGGVWITVGLTIAVALSLLGYTGFGRHVFAVGSNEAAARLCGMIPYA